MSQFSTAVLVNIISDFLLSDKDTPQAFTEAINNNAFNHTNQKFFNKDFRDVPCVYYEKNEGMSLLSKLLFADYVQYMQDDILVKVDRASMSTSLEGRNPLLDHRIVEFAAQLPDEYKYYRGVKKRILKDIVCKYVPRELMDKPKTGFSVPLASWLDDKLMDYVEYHLSNEKVKQYDVLNPDFVKEILNAYRGKYKSLAPDVWKILQLQAWCELWNN